MSIKIVIIDFIKRIKSSSLAKDSFWSVFGNAVSMVILMISGIIIARLVGKEMYGQYGIVKNLMTSFASFAAFGFGYSTTKLIASDSFKYGGISVAAPKIVVGISLFIFLFCICFATPISNILNKPDFEIFILYIGVLMFFKALFTVGTGILAGYKRFKNIGLNAIFSALFILIICYPFTKKWGLNGALIALILYQILTAFLALFYAYSSEKRKNKYRFKDYIEILKKTIPISVHEISFTFSVIAIVMIILHNSSYGEYALYSIASQWNAVIIVIPTLLMNLTLSYLSADKTVTSHRVLLRRILSINILSTLFPFCVVFFCVPYIVKFYGNDFIDLEPVLYIAVFTTFFYSITLVFQSNLMSEGRSWYLAVYRVVKDIFEIVLLLWVFNMEIPYNHAIIAVSVNLFSYTLYVFILVIDYIVSIKSMNK